MVAASFFLIDVWCLGVKDAFFVVMTPRKFEDRIDELSRQQPFIDIDPSVARKLLHDAAVYAAGLGLAPSEDFAQVEAIFGDISMAKETFTFGKNGKPFFISGPHIRRILDTLAKRAGPDGFNFRGVWPISLDGVARQSASAVPVISRSFHNSPSMNARKSLLKLAHK